MSTFTLTGLVALVLGCSLAAQQAAQADDSLWEVGAGAVFLNRDASYTGAFVVDNGHNTVMGGSAVATGFHSGINIDATRHLSDSMAVNARFFGIDDWTVVDSAVTTNGAWLYQGAALGNGAISDISSTFGSDLYSGEFNFVHPYSDRLDLIAGFRWLSIDESLNLSFFEGMIDYSNYEGFVKNDLYGVQGGARLSLFDQGGPFTLDGTFKAGIYGNDARYDGAYVNGLSAQIVNSTTRVAFVGDIGITGSVLICDNVSLSAGYQLLWVDGIALLGEQLAAANWATLSGGSTDGNAFYHGAVVNVTVLR